jgi:hypothetical protein
MSALALVNFLLHFMIYSISLPSTNILYQFAFAPLPRQYLFWDAKGNDLKLPFF